MSDACIIHLENHWKKLISEANESFSNKDYTSALHRYEEALFRGEVLNNYIDDCIRIGVPFIPIYLISCYNLSNTYLELGETEKAGNILKGTVHYLLHVSGKPNVHPELWQQELKKSGIYLLNFLKENEPDE